MEGLWWWFVFDWIPKAEDLPLDLPYEPCFLLMAYAFAPFARDTVIVIGEVVVVGDMTLDKLASE